MSIINQQLVNSQVNGLVPHLMPLLSNVNRDSRTMLHKRNKMGAIYETANFLKGTYKGKKKR